jgi:hypothetical protein
VVAVYLRGGCDENPLAEAMAVLEHDLGAAQVRDERLHGLLHDESHAHSGCQVVDDVALVDELVDRRPVEDGVDHEVEPVPLSEVLDVVERPCREVVERPHLVALVEKELGEVRADEARSARDQGLARHRRGRVQRPSGEPV